VVKCEAAVSESKAALDAVTKSLHNLQQEVETLEVQVPHLEEIKTAAAARRDFKAAGKASKEIKEFSARLAECKAELDGEASERKASAENELKEFQAELEAAREIANEKEKESAVQNMEQLADNIKRLIATKNSVCGGALDQSVQSVGAFVLDAQIRALKMEGRTYGEKYGGWDELMADIGLEDEPVDAATPAEPSAPIEEEASPNLSETDSTAVNADTSAPSVVEDTMSKEEKMGKFRDVSKRLKAVEEKLEAAVTGEDFDAAAELDEALQQLLAEVEGLNMSDEEMEAALAEDGAPANLADNDLQKDINDQVEDHDEPAENDSEEETKVDAEPTDCEPQIPEKDPTSTSDELENEENGHEKEADTDKPEVTAKEDQPRVGTKDEQQSDDDDLVNGDELSKDSDQ
jgi:hypothetical protein